MFQQICDKYYTHISWTKIINIVATKRKYIRTLFSHTHTHIYRKHLKISIMLLMTWCYWLQQEFFHGMLWVAREKKTTTSTASEMTHWRRFAIETLICSSVRIRWCLSVQTFCGSNTHTHSLCLSVLYHAIQYIRLVRLTCLNLF